MKIINITLFTLIFVPQIQSFGFTEYMVAAGALFINSLHLGPSKDQLKVYNNFKQKNGSTLKSLNPEEEDYKDGINAVLRQYKAENKNINLFVIPNTFQKINASVFDNNIILTSAAASGLHKNANSTNKNITTVATGHEIGHIFEKNKSEENLFKKWLFIGSNIALFQFFHGILNTDMNAAYKCSSIAMLAGANYIFNSMFKAQSDRYREKEADLYAIKNTKNPVALTDFASYCKTNFAPTYPNTLTNNLFGPHPSWKTRINAFENAAKIREAQLNKQPMPNLRVYGKKLEDID